MQRIFTIVLLITSCVGLAQRAEAQQFTKTFAVNDYFGMDYDREPVSFDVTFPRPVAQDAIGLQLEGEWAPCQVEIVEGDAKAVTRARVWTHVSFPFIEEEREVKRGNEMVKQTVRVPADGKARHKVFKVIVPCKPGHSGVAARQTVTKRQFVGGVEIFTITNGVVHVKVPVGSVTFDTAKSAFEMPGPVVSISRDGKTWIGSGYLDSMRRVEAVKCEVSSGPVFFESKITYSFEDGKTYRSRVRLYAGKPYVQLVEDFDVGGASKFVFNYDEFFADAFFRPGDARLTNWDHISEPNPCGDFVRIHGQTALARLVIWSQFNYFRGKQETIALKGPDKQALDQAFETAMQRYQTQLQKYDEGLKKYKAEVAKYEADIAAYKKDPKKFRRKPKQPKKFRGREPRKPTKGEYEVVELSRAGATMQTTSVATPGGDATAVGAFYIRPDRWTRAKVNHVDLYLRPEVPGDRMTRGQVGLAGAKLRPAMEAWLVDGHREWAIFAVRAGEDDWFAKAHVREGVWPLDRLVRLPLVWNSDGSAVKPEDTQPGDGVAGGDGQTVLKGTRGRAGLQHYNGSNGNIRGTYPRKDGWDGKVTNPVKAEAGKVNDMVAKAMTAYCSSDDSAYPSFRAMLPWTHPEAINPFYQGMENMNFNADLYRYVTKHGIDLAHMGHPEAQRFIHHGEKSFDMALSMYVYPSSGCWEESHGYAGHTLKVVGPLAQALASTKGRKNFLEDVRLARMLEFFLYVHSPVDPEFGGRVVPPVGDHGLHRRGPGERFAHGASLLKDAKNAEIQSIMRRIASMMAEDGVELEGVKAEKPALTSRWLRGYGTVMRAQTGRMNKYTLRLENALVKQEKKDEQSKHDLLLNLPVKPGTREFRGEVFGKQPTFNRGKTTGTVKVTGVNGTTEWHIEVDVEGDKWVKGGKAKYTIRTSKKAPMATYTGEFNGTKVSGTVEMDHDDAESFLVLRAGQSWGHHHEDKGSMWFWGRNVHFFGDCSWGGPPGGTYWNKYKQGPASGTQIEYAGISNWTLPCKYAAPWIADEQYNAQAGYDYALARCMMPFNPKLDVSKSTPVALRNGYDRQVLFVHPDVLIVRDNVDANVPTIWRLHSYQPEGTTVEGNSAVIKSPQGVTGDLVMAYPEGVKLVSNDRDILNDKYRDADGNKLPFEELPKFNGSVELKWEMPIESDATWTFVTRGEKDKAAKVEQLDKDGCVTRVTLADGTVIVALMNGSPFKWQGEGVTFEGSVGLAVKRDGQWKTHAIRAKVLTVE